MFKDIKVVVTGGAGFIGSHISEELLKQGAHVVVIDNISTGKIENIEFLSGINPSYFKFEKCDIVSADAKKIIEDFKPQVCFHLAAQMNVRASVADPMFDARQNIEGTVNLLAACAQAGTTKFILSSTGGAIYGEQVTFPADEEHRTSSESPYGVSKRSCELYLEYFTKTSNLKTTSLRYANVYGPRQNAKGEAGVVAIFAERALKGEDIKINGSGEQTRDFVYVKDVVLANLLAATNKDLPKYSYFNVGTEIETSVNQVAKEILKATKKLGVEVTSKVNHSPGLLGEQMRSVVSTNKISKALNWKNSLNFEGGILETVRSFQAKFTNK